MNRVIDLTNINRDISNNRNIQYIVMHYVGAVSNAKNNGTYFRNAYRGASAHYFIDENDCVQVVEDKNISWHCGTNGQYKHPFCRNSNSIGIEMCCKNNGDWYFEDATISNTIELVKELMQKYNIPIENVIRHYDVTGKICPQPYVKNESDWYNFKSKLENIEMGESEMNEILQRLRRLEDAVFNNNNNTQQPVNKTFSVNQKVTLLNHATHYATGQAIPNGYKNKQYTVMQVGNGKVLLKELYSWVLNQDVQ